MKSTGARSSNELQRLDCMMYPIIVHVVFLTGFTQLFLYSRMTRVCQSLSDMESFNWKSRRATCFVRWPTTVIQTFVMSVSMPTGQQSSITVSNTWYILGYLMLYFFNFDGGQGTLGCGVVGQKYAFSTLKYCRLLYPPYRRIGGCYGFTSKPPAARNGVNAITQKPRDGLFSNLVYTLVVIVSWPD